MEAFLIKNKKNIHFFIILYIFLIGLIIYGIIYGIKKAVNKKNKK